MKKTRGFTLIELLVVIAIISLLVSILLPSLNKAKELAKRSICLSNFHSTGVSVQFYTMDNDGWLLTGVDYGGTNSSTPGAITTMLVPEYVDETTAQEMFVCPNDHKTIKSNAGDNFGAISIIGRWGDDLQWHEPQAPYIRLNDYASKAMYCENVQFNRTLHPQGVGEWYLTVLRGDGSVSHYVTDDPDIPFPGSPWPHYYTYQNMFREMDKLW